MSYKKLVRIDPEPDQASERLVRLMESNLPHGKPTQLMRNWILAGFMLDECGHGIMDFLLAIDKSPMSPQKRLKGLIQFFEHCSPEDAPKITPTIRYPAVTTDPLVDEKPIAPGITISEPAQKTKPRKRQSLLGPK